MSTIKVNSIKNTSTDDGGIAIDNSGHVQVDGVQLPTAGALSNRNLIINGDCRISQRGTSFSIATGQLAEYTVDRFKLSKNSAATFTVTQESDGPAGFNKSVKIATATADTSLGSTEYNILQYNIEGQDLQHLNYGTSDAKSTTLSFWVKSNMTGNLSVTSEPNAGPPFLAGSVAISSANTWEYKTITFIGNTATAIDDDNTTGIEFQIWLDGGSAFSSSGQNTTSWHTDGAARVNSTNQINLQSSTSNYIQFTGFQYELGEKATPFEHRSYGDELARCQRYYERRTVGSQNNERLTTTGLQNGSTTSQFPVQHLVPKRATPDVNVENLGNSNNYDGSALGTPTAWALDNTGIFVTNIALSGLSGGALGRAVHWAWSNTTPAPFIEIDSEL